MLAGVSWSAHPALKNNTATMLAFICHCSEANSDCEPCSYDLSYDHTHNISTLERFVLKHSCSLVASTLRVSHTSSANVVSPTVSLERADLLRISHTFKRLLDNFALLKPTFSISVLRKKFSDICSEKPARWDSSNEVEVKWSSFPQLKCISSNDMKSVKNCKFKLRCIFEFRLTEHSSILEYRPNKSHLTDFCWKLTLS